MASTWDLYGSGLNENRSKMDPLPFARSLNFLGIRALLSCCNLFSHKVSLSILETASTMTSLVTNDLPYCIKFVVYSS